ncbi:restriction endonuclease subunit S [Bacteroides ovatus]|uniref:restriction endonuclease subunit S n=1 Tax=Bacteroides ovatus TaxID=28116 RepID=UPI002165F32E|nr:restriction endonuclease subunit S [Bacteroides ovatus]MCS2801809.1 restriction endonuclease subunit S [Bacteroides ovatus]
MEEWKEYELGELITLNSGGTPDKSNKSYWVGDIPWISAKFMYDDYLYSSISFGNISMKCKLKNGSRLAPKGSILLLTRGSGLFNRIPVCYVMRDLAYNQDVKCLESKNKELISTKFLFYWLMGNKNSIGAILETTGIGAGKIDTNRLKNIRIALPPKEYQQALIGFAESIMHKIELNRRINDNLN